MRQLKTRKDLSMVSNRTESLNKYLSELNKLEIATSSKETELGKRLLAGDQTAIDELISLNLRFVVNVAKQYQWSTIPVMDLINEGNVGLVIAAKKWDPTRGFKFISYAVWYIRQKILQSIKDHGKIVRLPTNRGDFLIKVKMAREALESRLERLPTHAELANELGLSEESIRESLLNENSQISLDYHLTEDFTLMDVVADENSPNPYLQYETKTTNTELSAVLEKVLKPREFNIIVLRFGLNGNREHDLKEISEEVGISRERVRQLINQSLRRLRWRCENLEKLLS